MFLTVSLNGFVVLHRSRYSSTCDFEDWWLFSVKMDRFRISLSVLRNILAATYTYTGLSLLFFFFSIGLYVTEWYTEFEKVMRLLTLLSGVSLFHMRLL